MDDYCSSYYGNNSGHCYDRLVDLKTANLSSSSILLLFLLLCVACDIHTWCVCGGGGGGAMISLVVCFPHSFFIRYLFFAFKMMAFS